MSKAENQWWQTEDNDEVATSPDLWRPIKERIGGFDVDPASGCEPTPIAESRFTKEDDGLAQEWEGNVWLNPPFSDKTPWYKKLVSQYESGNVERAVAVAPVDLSCDWFHDWFNRADVICFLDGRDWYVGHGDSPSFSTMLGVWNPTQELESWLHGMGTVVHPSHDGAQSELARYEGEQ
jgi:hypothetical protein